MILRYDLKPLQSLYNLTTLNIIGNKVSTISDLKPLQFLPKLTNLYITGNPVTLEYDFPRAVFNMLPSVQIIDHW